MSKLANRYAESNVLERHHIGATLKILAKEQNNIFIKSDLETT